MAGVTREEAVLFLCSIQDRIELRVQVRPDDTNEIVAAQKGDSFYIKTHFIMRANSGGTLLSFWRSVSCH